MNIYLSHFDIYSFVGLDLYFDHNKFSHLKLSFHIYEDLQRKL